MNALWLALLSFAALLLGYFFYGRFIATKLFKIDPSRATPSHEMEDGRDYVPTKPTILFGHHFASISGLGPILGPAIAVIWGWLPGVLWVVFGTIFIGAVHDFASLFISIRHKGQSVATVTESLMGRRGRLLFLLIIFFLLALAMGVFALVVSMLFTDINPQAVVPVFSLIPIAMLMGVMVYKLKLPLWLATAIGLILMFAALGIGVRFPAPLYQYFLPEEVQVDGEAAVAGNNTVEVRAEYDRAVEAVAAGRRFFLEDGELLTEAEKDELVAQATDGKPEVWELKPEFPKSFELYLQAKEGGELGDISDAVIAQQSAVTKAAGKARSTWKFILLAYAFIASILPVWLLLQPRDYLNSCKLYLGVGLMLVGMVVLAPTIAAPALRGYDPEVSGSLTKVLFSGTEDVKRLLPLLFMTIACGAVSGFHSLVSSGTTAKQIDNESQARAIGYGGMVAEGVLAIIVIIACTGGIAYMDGYEFMPDSSPEELSERWSAHYGSWKKAGNLGTKLGAVTRGGGLFISKALGAPIEWSVTFVALVCVAFAMTTLDSGTRLLRYNIEEFGGATGLRLLSNRYFASLLAVGGLAFFAFYKTGVTDPTTGETVMKPAGLALWQLFGATNQLLASLALLLITVFLYKRRAPIRYTILPLIFMGVVTLWALAIKLSDFIDKEQWRLFGVTSVILLIALWLVVEAVLACRRAMIEEKPEATA